MTTSGSLFASAIEHHLELKRRNQHLDDDLPLEEFRVVVPELLQRKIVVKMLISALQLEVMLDRGSKQRTARSHPPSSRSVVTWHENASPSVPSERAIRPAGDDRVARFTTRH